MNQERKSMSKMKQPKQIFDPTKCIPNTNINDYFIFIFPDVPENCKGGKTGYVGNHSNKELKLYIEIDDDFMYQRKYRTVCFCCDCENYSQSSIVMTSSFWQAMKDNRFLYVSIWHEVGHFHTTRYFNTRFDGKSAQKYRDEFLNRKEIMPEEKAADLFALYYTSKEDVIKDLNWLIKARRARAWEPDEIKMKAVYELGQRKRFLSSFNNEEEIQDELRRLCGVTEFESI